MSAYYNEIDPYAAQWLRNLIAAGHIAAGDVDERSIVDVAPSELAGYTQCHFFAGIGVWSLALRRAGWADDRPIWTGSCPCQPFSAAGKGKGFDDERHLWPAFGWLIQECRPAIITGEQVASKDAEPWLDLVQADVEAMGYRFGAVPFPSAGVGAPHIRDRLYWVADANHQRRAGQHPLLQRQEPGRVAQDCVEVARGGAAHGLGDSDGKPAGWNARGAHAAQAEHGSQSGDHHRPGNASDGVVVGLADNLMQQRQDGQPGVGASDDAGRRVQGPAAVAGLCSDLRPGPTNSLWRDADWLFCRDGKWRPVEPGTFPLVDGSAGRVGRVRADQERIAAAVPRKDQGSRAGRLKGYGNAINAEAARVWIETVMECIP